MTTVQTRMSESERADFAAAVNESRDAINAVLVARGCAFLLNDVTLPNSRVAHELTSSEKVAAA